jgi:putative sterol carrier protein
MAEMNVSEMMRAIPDHFNPEKAKGASGVVQCVFSGEQASNWVIRIQDGVCTVEEDRIDNPDLTIRADAADGINVIIGKMDAMRAYMMGKIKVFGDLSLGMKLTTFFN